MSAFSVLWSIDVCLEIVSVTKQNVHVKVDIFNLYGDFSLLFSWKSSSRIEYTVELFHIYRIEQLFGSPKSLKAVFNMIHILHTLDQCHESRKRHLRRPHFSKRLTKLAIFPDYKRPGMLCLALPARCKVRKLDFQSEFSMSKII